MGRPSKTGFGAPEAAVKKPSGGASGRGPGRPKKAEAADGQAAKKATSNPRKTAAPQRGRPATSSKNTQSLKESVSDKREKSASKPKAAKTPNKQTAKRPLKLEEQPSDIIFSLDIGTRNVVGALGRMEGRVFKLLAGVTTPHSHRAMADGQIEDIKEVSGIVKSVKEELEEKSGLELKRVSIAAAGRALKTCRAELDFVIDPKAVITEKTVKSFEIETVMKAQEILDSTKEKEALPFYCVGHTVIKYELDDYKIKTLVGHKGNKVNIELIATFLPGEVIESLYAVMDDNGLIVSSLTLEPIAAMNVIIPPEIRLINIALVDIGAGTSDIAISQNGSIVAYAMSTIAGDEITEEIIKSYLVDFETAEEMKQSGDLSEIEYTDILGYTHVISDADFFSGLQSVVGALSEDIASNIIKSNGKPPAAVFLIGGGSLIPGLCGLVAEKLGMPEDKVAVGGHYMLKHVEINEEGFDGPEFVTPIGIGVTATLNGGYDFSVVTLNGKNIRICDTRAVAVIDILMLAGYRNAQIIGHTGRNLSFTLNGEKQLMKGETSLPCDILLNGAPVTLDTPVRQADVIEFTPAVSGANASVKILDIAGDVSPKTVKIDDVPYNFGVVAQVGGKTVGNDYQIQNFDSVTVSIIDTLGDLFQTLPFDAGNISFYKSGKLLGVDYYLNENDYIITGEKEYVKKAKEGGLAKAIADKSAAKSAYAAVSEEEAELQNEDFEVILNGKPVKLPPRPNNMHHEFIELMAIADIELDNPPDNGNIVITLNGDEVSFITPLKHGDSAVIKWET
jgi:cell division protein FtsA